MKKIMIYAKPSNTGKNVVLKKIKENSTVILLFSFFLSGLVIGSKTYLALSDFFGNQFNMSLDFNSDMGSFLSLTSALVIIGIVVGVFGASSCFGLPLLWLLLFGFGYLNAVILTEMITVNRIQGLEYFALVMLPGAVLRFTALLLLCEISCVYSKKTAVNILFNGREELNLKQYLLYFVISVTLFLLSLGLNYISYKIFAGLF